MKHKIKLNNTTVLAIIAICLLAACYELAFKKTIEAWQLNKQMSRQANNSNLDLDPRFLQKRNARLNKIVNLFKLDTVNYRNQIVSQIALTGEQYNVKIVEVPLQNIIPSAKFLTQKIQMKGNFKSLLTTLNRLENIKKIGFIRSVVFKNNNTNGASATDTQQLMDVYTVVIK